MGLNEYCNEAGNFTKDIGKADEPVSAKLGLLETEFELLKSSVNEPNKLRHQVYDMLFILFEVAAQHGLDLDLEWEKGRRNKSAKYGTSGYHTTGTIYDKLVRDKIPEICAEVGLHAITRQLKEKEFDEYLAIKLKEESQEYFETRDIKELADVLEVIDAITDLHKAHNEVSNEQIRKREERGGFNKRILLLETRRID